MNILYHSFPKDITQYSRKSNVHKLSQRISCMVIGLQFLEMSFGHCTVHSSCGQYMAEVLRHIIKQVN